MSSRVQIPAENEEFKYKEQLYGLFYELTSEVKGKDIELEEEEYINNIQTIKFPKLISYIQEMIHILINKHSNNNDNTRRISANDKATDDNAINDNNHLYERIIQHYEARERQLLRKHCELMEIKEIYEMSISNYHHMEVDFIQMKEKVKYEEGRFLNNERKDNEIIIIRQENAILKKTITELEKKCNSNDHDIKHMNKELKKLKESIKQYKGEIDKMKKEMLKSSNINININNNGQSNIAKCLFCNNNIHKSIDKCK